ncbi:MAG: division/cell wall cluster transcriptional repressor MraZ [Clostridiaceae bacterium]|nr:division/cell wall cluster transcriptional repressor MraZ [Clostridiaceae bacterium]
MLAGEYRHSVDAKGRIIMPSKFREELGESFVVTKGFEGCLVAYSNEEWEKFVEKLRTLPENQKNVRRLLRILLSGASTVEVDKQGRLLLPQNLREAANITKEVTIIGVLNKVEIWDSEAWQRYTEDEEGLSLEDAAESIDMLF